MAPLILDAAPLRAFLCFGFLERTPHLNRQRLHEGLFRDRELLLGRESEFNKAILAAPRIIVTPIAAAKALRFRDAEYLKPFEASIRELAGQVMRGFEDRCPSLGDLWGEPLRPLTMRYGLADAACLWAAREFGGKLLTDDGRLFQGLQADPQFEIVLARHFLPGLG